MGVRESYHYRPSAKLLEVDRAARLVDERKRSRFVVNARQTAHRRLCPRSGERLRPRIAHRHKDADRPHGQERECSSYRQLAADALGEALVRSSGPC